MNVAVKSDIWRHVERAVEQHKSERSEQGITFAEWLLDNADVIYHLLDQNFSHEHIVDFLNNARDEGEINLTIKLTISNFRMTWYRFTRRYNLAHNARDTKVKNITAFKEHRSKVEIVGVCADEPKVIAVEKPITKTPKQKPQKQKITTQGATTVTVDNPKKDIHTSDGKFDEARFNKKQRESMRDKYKDLGVLGSQSTEPPKVDNKVIAKNEVKIIQEDIPAVSTDNNDSLDSLTDSLEFDDDDYKVIDEQFNTDEIDQDMANFAQVALFQSED